MDDSQKRLWDVILGIVAPVITILGIVVGVWQFEQGEQNKVKLEYSLISKKDDVDFKRRLWLERLSTYRSIANLAGRIAVAPDRKSLDRLALSFMANYWGSMVLVEDKPVEKAMIDLNTEIVDFRNGWSDQSHLKIRADALARACRKSIETGDTIR